MGAFYLVRVGERGVSYKVTGQPKNISVSTPTHITQDLMYHHAVMVGNGNVLNVLLN